MLTLKSIAHSMKDYILTEYWLFNDNTLLHVCFGFSVWYLIQSIFRCYLCYLGGTIMSAIKPFHKTDTTQSHFLLCHLYCLYYVFFQQLFLSFFHLKQSDAWTHSVEPFLYLSFHCSSYSTLFLERKPKLKKENFTAFQIVNHQTQ